MTPNPILRGQDPKENSPLLGEHSESLEKDEKIHLDVKSKKSDTGEDVSVSVKSPELHVYSRRWWILGIFSMLAFMQSFVWITFSSISVSAKEVFGWTDTTIALLVDWGNIPVIVLVYPLCWLLDTQGLRFSTLLSAFLMAAGTGVRCISSDPTIATPLIHFGHILNGIAGIVFTGAPAQLSSAWFPAQQRTTATSLAVLTNYLGIAFGYLVGPIFIPHPYVPACNNDSWNEQHPCHNATLAADLIEEERFEIMRLLYYECGASCILFLATFLYFPDRPPLPPTASANQQRLRVSATLSKLLKNRNFWIICLGYTVTSAVAGNWLSVLGTALEPFGISQAQTGLMGMTSTMIGAVLSLVLARFVDYLGGKIKLCLVLLLGCGCVTFIWYALLFFEVVVPTLGTLYPVVIMAGIVAYTGSPLYMEMSVEATYPIQEGVVGTVLQAIMNLMGSFYLALFLIPDIGVSWMVWALIGSTVLGVVLACMQSETYHRSDVDRSSGHIDYQAINSGGPEDV